MTDVVFEMTLHSRCRVGASFGRDGRDVSVDHHEPLHGDHLKGLMRREADRLVDMNHVDAELLTQVFGTTTGATRWTWTAARPEPDVTWVFEDRHRVRIDRVSGTAVKDHIVRGETAWTPIAHFSVLWCGPDTPAEAELALVSLSGAAVHHLGAWRRRGLGWVGVVPLGRDLAEDVTTVTGQQA